MRRRSPLPGWGAATRVRSVTQSEGQHSYRQRPGSLRYSLCFLEGRKIKLYYALTFLIIALIAAALGFGGIAGAATGIAKILFFVFIVLFLVSLVMGGVRQPVP